MARPRESAAKCSICDTSFARQEHLTRHIRIHTREKPFQCDRCGKAFARMDVLNRHVAAHEEAAPETPASARACKECAASRVRCSRTQPCKRCTEKNFLCVFPTDRKRRASALSEPDENGNASPPELSTEFAAVDNSRPAFNPVVGNEIDQGTGFQSGSPSAQFPSQGGFGMPNDSAWMNSVGNVDLQPSPTSFYNPAPAGMGISIVNWMSPQNPQAVDWDTQLADFNVTNEGMVGHGGFPFFFAGADIAAPNAEWSAHTPQGQNPSLGISAITPSRTNGEGELMSSHSVMDSATSTSTDGRYYVDGSGARAPFGGRSNTRRSVVGIDVMHEKNAADDPRSIMPSPAELVPAMAYENMCQRIRDQPHLPSINMETLPSLSHVQLFVRYYFDKFHPIFPFVRRQSFPDDCSKSWLLLLAVAVVGSRYLSRIYGAQPGDILQQILQDNLDQSFYHSGPDDREPAPFVPGESLAGPSIRVLQAGVLNTICMLHSGNKANVERSFLNRHRLIEACHGLGLLTAASHGSLGEPGDTQRLPKWLREESDTRTGMMIWLLDSMFLYAFGGKPLIHLDDIEVRLPCREELWEASTERTNLSGKVTPTLLHEALEMIYMEKRLPQGLGEFSTVILINAIYRKTKDVVASAQTQLNSWTPTAIVQRRMKSPLVEESWPPATPTLSKWRNSACDGLDMLHWSANSKAAGLSGLEHHTILQLHLSRLIILTPTAHIQTFATDSSTTQSGSRPESNRYIAARNKVLQWTVRDQFKARLSVIHCGALIWHVRRYSRDSVVEPFAIYIATLVLWAFCVSVQFVGQSAFENDASTETPAVGSGSTPHVPDLTEEDIPEPSFIHLDRPLDDELVQLFVQMGHKMSGYISRVGNIHDPGAPRKILLEGIRLLTRDTPTVSHPEEGERPIEKPCYTWGIEGSYIESLGRLVRATAGVSNGHA